MIKISRYFKVVTILIILLVVSVQSIPPAGNLIYASDDSPVELQTEETEDLKTGDTFDLTISKTEKAPESTVISLPDNTKPVEIDTAEHPELNYDEAKNQIEIKWDTEKSSEESVLPILITAEGEINLTAETEMETDTVDSNTIHITASADEPDNSPEEEDKPQSDTKKNDEPDDKSDTDDGKTDNNQTEEEEAALPAGDEVTEKDNEEKKDNNKGKDPKTEDDKTKEPSDSITDDKKEKEEGETSGPDVQADTKSVKQVNSWNSFLNALENADIKEIQITSGFTASGLFTTEYPINGNKTISGNSQTINFGKHRLNLKQHQLKVKDLAIRADQVNIAGNANASVFYSEHADGTLILENTSFDGIQHGQVARMIHGHIKIAGKAHFQTSGPFEVFEAKNITIMEGADFLGETTQTGTYRKETLNLYNNPVITVEPNASVLLKTRGRNSIINELDGTNAVIDIGENATFEVYADNITTSYGEPLINFPGRDSAIRVGNNATLDIQNHRDGRGLGSLITMYGNLTTAEQGSKVAYWKKGSNSDNPSGSNYIVFPRVINGHLGFDTDRVISADAAAGSSLAESDDANYNKATFHDVFLNKDTSNVKRLHISAAGKPLAPETDILTEDDDTLTGTAAPGIQVEIRDASGHTWKTTTDEKTGKFSVALGDSAPYEAGDQLFAKAIDMYGAESEETAITVIGTKLSFRVPESLYFQQTMIKDEDVTIPREDKEWSIDVTNTRGSGWKVTAKADNPLETANGHQLDEDALVFIKDGQTTSLKDSVLIRQDEAGDKRNTTIGWDEDEGILLQLNPEASRVEANSEYATTIDWTLTDAP